MMIDKYYEAVEIHREDKIIYARFLKPHRVISTCQAAGGIREDLEYLYNHQSCEPSKHSTVADRIMRIGKDEYRQEVAGRHGLPDQKCATLGTAANMRCAAVVSRRFRDLEVVAVATGGVETNGGRVGDPATVYESEGRFERLAGETPKPGTINTMLFIGSELTKGALVRSIITATEAKTAALQELSVPSRYSEGLATGTGTDQIGVACLLGDKHPLGSAGKHSKLGELIGVTVHDAIKETLVRQNGLTPESRCSVLAHLDRFGIKRKEFEQGIASYLDADNSELLKNNLDCLDHDPLVVAAVIAFIHLNDQIVWDVLPRSCLPEMLASYAAQISAAASGRYDKVESYRCSLSAMKLILANETLHTLICRALALGFADKWRFSLD